MPLIFASLGPSKDVDIADLSKRFQSREFEDEVRKAETENEKNPVEKRLENARVRTNCYKPFIAKKFSELIRTGHFQARNKRGILLPLLPMEGSTVRLGCKIQLTGKYYEYRVKPSRKLGAKVTSTFQMTVFLCPTCERIVAINWNGVFSPVLSEEDFEMPFDLQTICDKLLYEPPIMNQPTPMTFEEAKWLLNRAKIVFQNDGASKGLNAPVAVLGDIHGNVTTLQKVFEYAAKSLKVRQTRILCLVAGITFVCSFRLSIRLHYPGSTCAAWQHL